MSKENYTAQELMIASAARELRDGQVVIVGIGVPVLASLLAQRTHAPNIVMVYESGIVGAQPTRLSLSIGDPNLVSRSLMICDVFDTFGMIMQRGNVDAGFVSGAQIDKFGNLNSTVIGDYSKPKARLPGSGGAYEIAALVKKLIIIMPHDRRRFVEKVDFITSPGYLSGPGDREKYGLRGTGPDTVLSTLGILKFDKLTKEMYLESYHPGVAIDEVKENTGWELKISPTVHETMPPTTEQIRLLRQELDPKGIFLRRHSKNRS
jgi:glutaconate CoA-transferase subunit B